MNNECSDLGPSNSAPIYVEQKPCLFQPDRTLTDLCSYSYRDFRYRSVHRTSSPGFRPNGTFAYRINLIEIAVGYRFMT